MECVPDRAVPAQGPSSRSLVIDLAGEWQVREALGETWRWYVGDVAGARNNAAEAAAAVAAAPGWLPARVPGAVIDDLVRAGELPDPRVGRASRSAEWVADRAWVHRRLVELPAAADDELVALELDGVDPAATVFWDGVELGRLSGLYQPGRFELGGADRAPGVHTLAVVVDPAPDSQPQVGRTELVRVHGPRMGYGWDFCPRVRHQGVWRPVRVVIGATRIVSVSARAELDESLRRGSVEVQASVATASSPDGTAVSAELRRDGVVVARAGGVTVAGVARLRVAVDDPELWWPNGLGAQALYQLVVTAGADEHVSEIGFRRLEFVQNAGAEPSALPYTAVVNGRAAPLVGWNWVPADALYGAIPAGRVDHLVGLAARSGARLLRVWGGGLIESEQFYRACDRLGLLVWQEFSQSSSGMQSAPSCATEFLESLVRDAEVVVPARTHHPSLAIWGGGNELDEGGVPLDDARSPALAALADAVHRLDPGRHWLPTSPTGPEFHNRLDRIAANPRGQHDVHGPWEHQGLESQQTLYNAGTSLAHSEFGVEGMTNLRALEALVPAEDRWPPDRSNPVYRHLGEWWNNAPFVDAAFGGRLLHEAAQLPVLQRASQWLQAAGLQYALEADRRRWPQCSIVLPWQLGESFPNAWCTSAVDFHGAPKPAYHAAARAFAPRRASLRVERVAWAGHEAAQAEAWLWADAAAGASPETGRYTLRARGSRGEVLAEVTGRTGAVRHPRPIGTLAVDCAAVRDGVLVWELEWADAAGAIIDRELQTAVTGADLASLLDLPAPALEVRSRLVDGRLVVDVRNEGDVLALAVRLTDARPIDAEGWLTVDGDPRPLLPGEHRELHAQWSGAPGPVHLEVWNAPGVLIDPAALAVAHPIGMENA